MVANLVGQLGNNWIPINFVFTLNTTKASSFLSLRQATKASDKVI